MSKRTETDSIGNIQVDSDKYWGAQTQRSLQNFDIGFEKMPWEIIESFAVLKMAAAETNHELGVLDKKKMEVIVGVCGEIIDGKLMDHFPLSVWQTGSGTQSNMNVNEVIANRAHVVMGGKLSDKTKKIHPKILIKDILSMREKIKKEQIINKWKVNFYIFFINKY